MNIRKFDAIDKWLMAIATIIIIGAISLIITICIVIIRESETNKYDINNDGVISPADYVAIKNYIMNEEEERYDVNDDGVINSIDYVKVYNYIMNKAE